jgi:ATP-dependent Clp protease ATP-binding subunit ClpA
MSENINDSITEQAQKPAHRTYEIASQYRHPAITTEHVLFALFDVPDEALVQVFQYLSIDAGQLKKEVAKILGRQAKVRFWRRRNYQMKVTPQVKSALQEAVVEAKREGRARASAAHIFWATVNAYSNSNWEHRQSAAAHMLQQNGITPDKVHDALLKIEFQRAGNEALDP